MRAKGQGISRSCIWLLPFIFLAVTSPIPPAVAGSSQITIHRCIADQPTPPTPYVVGHAPSEEEQQNDDWYHVGQKVNLCLDGYAQVLPHSRYDVLGLSPALSLDDVQKFLDCKLEDVQTGAFRSAVPDIDIRNITLSCFGKINGTQVSYSPNLTISDFYRIFVVTNPEYQVCGPQIIVRNGDTYRELLRKYGNPVDAWTSESSQLEFAKNAERISVGVEEVDRSLSPFVCEWVLHFRSSDDNANNLIGVLQASERAASVHVKPNF